MFYILNNFSPSMFNKTFSAARFIRISQSEARELVNECQILENTEPIFISGIESEGMAKAVSKILDTEVIANKISANLVYKDKGLIFIFRRNFDENSNYDYLDLCKMLDDNDILIYYFEVI